MSKTYLGIDLGGTGIKLAVVREDGNILGKHAVPTPVAEGPDAVMDAMAAAADALLGQAGLTRDAISVAGIGTPGPMDWQTGIVYNSPNLPGWKDVPLAQSMQDRLGLPCFIDNDASAACYGEYWLGAGRGTQSMCLLTLGTGVGGGIVIDGQLLRGIDGTAAEIGHQKLLRGGRLCGCGGHGCLEAYGSVTGMVITAKEGLESGKESALTEHCNGDFSAITGKMISECAQQGDPFAQSVIEETGIWIGLGISNLIHLLNPERVVLCGGMIQAGDALFDPIRRTAKANAFEVPADRVQILPAGLGPDSGVLGAAGCAAARLKAQGKQ